MNGPDILDFHRQQLAEAICEGNLIRSLVHFMISFIAYFRG